MGTGSLSPVLALALRHITGEETTNAIANRYAGRNVVSFDANQLNHLPYFSRSVIGLSVRLQVLTWGPCYGQSWALSYDIMISN
jgi:hypothetical protein